MRQPLGQASQTRARYQREVAPRPTLGTINVIFATPSRGIGSFSKRHISGIETRARVANLRI